MNITYPPKIDLDSSINQYEMTFLNIIFYECIHFNYLNCKMQKDIRLCIDPPIFCVFTLMKFGPS